jgi:hypothetical protein
LSEIGTLSFGANGFTQEAAVCLAGQHEPVIDRKRVKRAMSLTPSFNLFYLVFG